MGFVLDALSWLCLLGGSFFAFAGALGLVRFPDFFTRCHGAGVTDTLGAGLILLGLALQAGPGIAAMKLGLIYLFMLFTAPTATHALAKAALHGGLKPLVRTPEASPSNG
jgi:multicomponent Na+:H+ antiporter subunit G